MSDAAETRDTRYRFEIIQAHTLCVLRRSQGPIVSMGRIICFTSTRISELCSSLTFSRSLALSLTLLLRTHHWFNFTQVQAIYGISSYIFRPYRVFLPVAMLRAPSSKRERTLFGLTDEFGGEGGLVVVVCCVWTAHANTRSS